MATRTIDTIVIHCSDTPNGRWHDAEDINRWHKERGWNEIGYHWVIPPDGMPQQGRDEAIPGAHVRGHNQRSIGICLIGRDEFNDDQMRALEGLVIALKSRWPGADVVGHNDLDKGKTCPNFNAIEWWSDVRQRSIG